jgi:hypothetical protein
MPGVRKRRKPAGTRLGKSHDQTPSRVRQPVSWHLTPNHQARLSQTLTAPLVEADKSRGRQRCVELFNRSQDQGHSNDDAAESLGGRKIEGVETSRRRITTVVPPHNHLSLGTSEAADERAQSFATKPIDEESQTSSSMPPARVSAIVRDRRRSSSDCDATQREPHGSSLQAYICSAGPVPAPEQESSGITEVTSVNSHSLRKV